LGRKAAKMRFAFDVMLIVEDSVTRCFSSDLMETFDDAPAMKLTKMVERGWRR
jgi:hypothetical protein